MIDRVVIACFVILMGLLMLEIFAIDMHPEVAWERIPGHMEIIGFVSHMSIVILCKWVGKHFLQRPEDYDG